MTSTERAEAAPRTVTRLELSPGPPITPLTLSTILTSWTSPTG